MLVAPVEAVEPVRRHQPGQHQTPDLTQHISRGAPGIRRFHVAAGDSEKVSV
jgi:hypothetical protein